MKLKIKKYIYTISDEIFCHLIWSNKKTYKLKIIGDEFILSLNIMFSDENIRWRGLGDECCFFTICLRRWNKDWWCRKLSISHTILICSRQHMRNKNKEDLIKSTGVEPDKQPLKIKLENFHNSRVPELGKLCVPWFVRVLGVFIVGRVDIPSLA